MPSPQYNPRRQNDPRRHQPPRGEQSKKNRRSGASATRNAKRVQIPGWLWIIVGTALGVFVSFLVRLAQTPPPSKAGMAENGAKPVVAAPAAAGASAGSAAKAATKPADATRSDASKPVATKPDATKNVTKFDFYTLLPEREVIDPSDRDDIEKAAGPQPAKPAKQAVPAAGAADTGEQLFLQAGSFRSAQEAERRRGQIRALGLDASVEQVTANGDTWYRVQVGPLTRARLNSARDRLSDADIDTLVLRQK